MALSSCGSIAIHYLLPFLWMMSRLAIVGRMAGVAILGQSLMSMNALLEEFLQALLTV